MAAWDSVKTYRADRTSRCSRQWGLASGIACSLIAAPATAQVTAPASTAFDAAGTYQFDLPSSATNIVLSCWGGGAGGGQSTASSGGGGGGGAGFQSVHLPHGGLSLTIVVGHGGAPRAAGESSQVTAGGTTYCAAGAGAAGGVPQGGTGGGTGAVDSALAPQSLSGSVGAAGMAAANGANLINAALGTLAAGGSGGASAGVALHGAGGSGGHDALAGGSGAVPGGGGGGGPTPGAGADGRVELSFAMAPASDSAVAPAADQAAPSDDEADKQDRERRARPKRPHLS